MCISIKKYLLIGIATITLIYSVQLTSSILNKSFAHVKNEITSEQNDIIVNRNEWNLILVNSWNKLPNNFGVKLKTLDSGHSIDERAYDDLITMIGDAKSEGLSPIICSSYRTIERQIKLYKNEVESYISKGYLKDEAQFEAGKWVAVPGTSEHNTGLAVDIVSINYQLLDEKQENTPEQKWLMKNSYKYGFILRYPRDKKNITGISYEPWHYRYVGKKAALEIYRNGLCLEEYLS